MRVSPPLECLGKNDKEKGGQDFLVKSAFLCLFPTLHLSRKFSLVLLKAAAGFSGEQKGS